MLIVWMSCLSLVWATPFRRLRYPFALTYFFTVAVLDGFKMGPPLAAWSVLCLLSFVIFLWGKRDLSRPLVWAGVFCAIMTISAGWHAHQVWPFSNPSMTGTLISLTLALEPGISWLAWVSAVVSGRTMPIAVWLVMRALWAAKSAAAVATIAAALIVAGMVVFLAKDDPERIFVWKTLLLAWIGSSWWTLLFGHGAGTTVEYLAKIETPGHQNFIWAHHDWLQIAFEYGLFGIVIVLFCVHSLLQDAKPKQRAALVGFAVAMCGNFPLHWPITALVMWINAREALLDQVQHRKEARNYGGSNDLQSSVARDIVCAVSDHCRPNRDSVCRGELKNL